MIRLNPTPEITICCPTCKTEFNASEWQVTGMHSMCSGNCPRCGKKYFQEIPVNAGLFYPGTLDAATGKRVDQMPMTNWYVEGLENAYRNRNDEKVNLEVRKHRELGRARIAILNTIDQTYGHALFELLNASWYLKQPDVDLIILVQRSMLWLVPDGAAQVWVADLSFGKAGGWYDDLARTINREVENRDNVYICRSFVQADSLDYNIEDYTRVKPFELDKWDELLEQKPVVTFIWRYDRFWKPVLPHIIDNRFVKKVIPGLLQRLRNNLQHRWILKFSKALRKEIPEVDFAIAGMDTRDRKIPGWIKDFRYPQHADDTAKLQCERYAESHLVMGCNGSSLVIPGCHAGAMINIVPGDVWAVSAGSFPFRVSSIGDTHFRYIMLPAEVSIKRLVNITLSVLRDRSLVLLHTSPPWRDHSAKLDNYAWSQARIKSLETAARFSNESGLVSRKKD